MPCVQRQYVFIHDTLKLIIDKKIVEMETKDDDNDNVYQNTAGADDNIYANQAFGK